MSVSDEYLSQLKDWRNGQVSFIKGYNDIEGTILNEFKVWTEVLHVKIKEITGHDPKLVKKYFWNSLLVIELYFEVVVLVDEYG